MKLKKSFQSYCARKIVEQLAQDIQLVQKSLAEKEHIAPWQVSPMSCLRMSLWEKLLSHPKCESILEKLYENGVNFNEDVEVELFGVDAKKDYKDFINIMIDIHQMTPMTNDVYGNSIVDEEEYEKWNRFVPNPNPKPITWSVTPEERDYFEDLDRVAAETNYGDVNYFNTYLTPKHFTKPTNTFNRSKQIEYELDS